MWRGPGANMSKAMRQDLGLEEAPPPATAKHDLSRLPQGLPAETHPEVVRGNWTVASAGPGQTWRADSTAYVERKDAVRKQLPPVPTFNMVKKKPPPRSEKDLFGSSSDEDDPADTSDLSDAEATQHDLAMDRCIGPTCADDAPEFLCDPRWIEAILLRPDILHVFWNPKEKRFYGHYKKRTTRLARLPWQVMKAMYNDLTRLAQKTSVETLTTEQYMLLMRKVQKRLAASS